VRRLCAIAASASLHVLAAVIITWLASKLSIAVPGLDTRPTILVVHLPSDPPGPRDERSDPTIKETTPADLGIQVPDGESTFSLPGFTFDFGKVISRAGSLFPFLTGRRSLEQIVAKCPTRGIKNHGDVLRALLAEQLRQHRREAVDGVGGQPTRRSQAGQGVESAVDVAAAVDQVETRRCRRVVDSHGGERERY